MLIDSTFFFPLISVEIQNCPKEAILELLRKEEIVRSDLVIFELSAKGSKLINEGKLTIEDLTEGLTAIQYHPSIETIPIHYSEIQILACELRKQHADFIDCLMVATAVNNTNCFLTFDKEIKRKTQGIWKKIIEKENKEFKVKMWEEYKKEK
jgi:predicted nucleic acid-binding protein